MTRNTVDDGDHSQNDQTIQRQTKKKKKKKSTGNQQQSSTLHSCTVILIIKIENKHTLPTYWLALADE